MTGRVRADRLLVERGLFESRAQAQAAIAAGLVVADGRTVARASEPLDPKTQISAERPHPWVSRAGLKLAHALSLWPVAVQGRVALDVGASTGGFTQVCLAAGAARVYAVDVGRGQLHPKVSADPRVVDLSPVDARDLDLPEAPGVVVCDASFIGLSKVLARPLDLAAEGADLIALVKPQFEVGPAAVGKGGLVKDPAARQAALDAAVAWLAGRGWPARASVESPITGGDGNLEFLVWAQKEKPPACADG